MKKNKKIKICLIIIIVIILIIAISTIAFYLLKNNEESAPILENIQIEENADNNALVIENSEDEAEEEFKKDTESLAQINTKIKKTASGEEYTSIGLISIPSLNIKHEILSSTSEELLKISVNKYWGPEPNEVGNLCILGHNYKDSRLFGNLPKIEKGAKVYITDLEGKTLTYKVYETDIIESNDVECTSQKTNGKTEITLITCYYEKGVTKATKRFIAKARVE